MLNCKLYHNPPPETRAIDDLRSITGFLRKNPVCRVLICSFALNIMDYDSKNLVKILLTVGVKFGILSNVKDLGRAERTD